MNHSFIVTSTNRANEKFTAQDKKYILCDRNWNDYGYYTLHELFLIVPDKPYNIKLADIRVFNYGQKFGERVSFNLSNHVSFISNIDSAERLVLFLSPEERKQLLSDLHISFSKSIYEDQPAFLKSVLRDLTLAEFESRQSQIKKIVNSELNISKMVIDNLDILKML